MRVSFLVMGSTRADLPRIRGVLWEHPQVDTDAGLVIHTFARSEPPFLKVVCEWNGMWQAARLEADLRVPRHTVILDEAWEEPDVSALTDTVEMPSDPDTMDALPTAVETEIRHYVADHKEDVLTQGERAVLTDIETLLKPLGWDEPDWEPSAGQEKAWDMADDERRGNALS